MAIPPSTSTGFLNALRSGIEAILNHNYDDARFLAESARLHGQLLAIHPELRECMRTRFPDLDADQAFETIPKVLLCLAEEGQPTHHNGNGSLLGVEQP